MLVWPFSPCPAAATAAGKPTILKFEIFQPIDILQRKFWARGRKLIEAFLEWALLQSWLIGAPLVIFVGLMSISQHCDKPNRPRILA